MSAGPFPSSSHSYPTRNRPLSTASTTSTIGTAYRFSIPRAPTKSFSHSHSHSHMNGGGATTRLAEISTSSSSTSLGSTMNSATPSDMGGVPPVIGAPQWQHRVSASFAAMAEQISSASQAVAMIPSVNETVLNEIIAKLETIEANQRALSEEMGELRKRMDGLTEGPEKFEKKLEEQVTAFNLDQLRLPARLHNATCHKSPMLIKAPPITAGKVPKNFPATKGEFEHLTKERYEAIMKEYNIPITGDTAAKRETLRGFLGIPCDDDVGNYKKH